jgi:hypothetical protein
MPPWEWLLRDIAACCKRCETTVGKNGYPELAPHRHRAMGTLAELGEAVDESLKIGEGEGDGSRLEALVEINRDLEIFRRTHLPFFTHYGPDTRYLTLLAAQLAEEGGFTIRTPIVGSFSSAGYWTDPTLSTICLPAGDHGQLLAFPDLVHELGHLQLSEADRGLTSRFLGGSIGPYTSSLGVVGGDPEYGARLYAEYLDWVGEFVADITATYVCGPAYGWQNLRLSAQTTEAKELWQPARPGDGFERFSHPSDLSRTAAIDAVLRATGQVAEAARLRAEWETLTAHAGKAPSTYSTTYPEKVLDDLVAMTLEWCRESDLTPFANAGPTSIVSCIDRAWREHLADPASTAQSEAHHVAELRARIEAAA